MRNLIEIAEDAKNAKREVAKLDTSMKNNAINKIADALLAKTDEILAANQKDLDLARENGMNEGLIDRLTLTKSRIEGIAEGCRQVAALADPVGELLWQKIRPNGLKIGLKRVAMGVIGMIYEARPNVTVDAAVLCFKAGSACILRSGKEAIHSSMCLANVMRDALKACNINPNAINILEDTSRQTATEMMKLNGYIIMMNLKGIIKDVLLVFD